MVTQFAIYARKLRKDRGETLKVMAEKMHVTSAFLCAIECGRKQVPLSWVEEFPKAYNLNKEETTLFLNTVDITNKNTKIDLTKLNKDSKEVSLLFARNIKDCDPETLEKLKKILKEQEENKK